MHVLWDFHIYVYIYIYIAIYENGEMWMIYIAIRAVNANTNNSWNATSMMKQTILIHTHRWISSNYI